MTDGEQVGHVCGQAMDPETGAIEMFIITTERDATFGIEANLEGAIHLPAEVIEAMRDYLLSTPPATACRKL